MKSVPFYGIALRLDHGDGLNLNEQTLKRQRLDADKRAGRRLFLGQILATDLADHTDHVRCVIHNIRIALQHVIKRGPDRGQRLFEVFKRLDGLGS